MKHYFYWLFLNLLVITIMPCLAADQDVRRHGARGDGLTLDTRAFQAAIDAASDGGGGAVRVPPGRYLVAHVELKSNITLRIEKEATLLGSTNRSDYAGKSSTVLAARNVEHFVVEGEGEINGQATADYGARWGVPQKPEWRTGLVRLENCRDLTIRGVTLLYSDSWTLHLRRCEHVRIDGITIRDNYRRLNSDGIDPNSCKDVKITRCRITAGDDAIVLKSTETYPCEDIEVSDCVLESATAGLKVGTESHGDFRRIRFRHCRIVNSPVGIGFFVKDGAVVQDVVAENIDMQLCPPTYHAAVPLFIDIEKRHPDSRIGAVRDVTFQNIRITGGAGVLLQGMPESWLDRVTLRQITFDVRDPQDYAKRKKPVGGTRTTHDERDALFAQMPTYAALAYMKNLTIDGLQVRLSDSDFQRFPRSALSLSSIEKADITDVTRTPAAGGPAVVEQHDCRQIRLGPASTIRKNP
jgi:hypothetical protein